MQTDNDFAEMVASLIGISQEMFSKVAPRDHSAKLQEVIQKSDIVLGIFPDPEIPRGFGHTLIKGTTAVSAVAAKGRHQDLSIAAIPCHEIEEAVAICDVFGDGKWRGVTH